VKILRDILATQDANGRRQQCIERVWPTLNRQLPIRKIDMRTLGKGMHTGVSASRAVDSNVRPNDFPKGVF
jgi:hypothetical protein